MSSAKELQQEIYCKLPIWLLGVLGLAGLALIWGFYAGLEEMVRIWGSSEEYTCI